MKKIYSFLLTATALCFLIPIIAADGDEPTTPQKGPDYYLNSDESIGYMKRISEPNTEGIYTITLESFATGESVKLQKSIPADIVLVLDVSGSMAETMSGRTRLAVMKDAVKAFIDLIDENDRIDPVQKKPRKTRLGNRIAIVAFSGPGNAGTTTPTANNSIQLNTGWRTLGDNQSVNDYTGYNYLIETALPSLNAAGGTFSNFGMEAAKTLLTLDDTHQLRTAVLFTDGDPGRGDYWDSTRGRVNNHTVLSNDYGIYTWRTANQAIGYANDIKKMADDTKGIISKVYTVSVINNPSACTTVYLDQVSSNYTNASQMADLIATSSNGTTYYYIENCSFENLYLY